MKRYRITHPSGASGYADLNQAAVKQYRAKGYRVELTGPSMVTVVSDGAR